MSKPSLGWAARREYSSSGFDSDGSRDDKQTPQRINVRRSIFKTQERRENDKTDLPWQVSVSYQRIQQGAGVFGGYCSHFVG